LARRQRVPDVSVVGGYTQEGRGNEAIQPPTANFGVSLPLPILYRNQGEIAKAEATLTAPPVQRDKVHAQVAKDVRTAWPARPSARARVDRMEARLLERARRARDLVDYQYQKGAVSLFERLDAERTFVAVEVEYYQAEADFWTSLYQLEQAVGTELVPCRGGACTCLGFSPSRSAAGGRERRTGCRHRQSKASASSSPRGLRGSRHSDAT